MRVLAYAPAFLPILPWSRIQMLPSDSETDIIYKLIQMSDMKSLTPTGTKGVAWMKLSMEPGSVQLRPIYCDARRSLWKQHANLDFPFSHERGLLSTFWELRRDVDVFLGGATRGFSQTLFKQMSLNVVYLLSLGCAAHLYSWGSRAGVNVISPLPVLELRDT